MTSAKISQMKIFSPSDKYKFKPFSIGDKVEVTSGNSSSEASLGMSSYRRAFSLMTRSKAKAEWMIYLIKFAF